MIRLGFIILFLLIQFGCVSIPTILPVTETQKASLTEACHSVFPHGRWRVTHRIDADLSVNGVSTFIGVTVGDTEKDRLRSALMTLEGIVLFEASYDQGNVSVLRNLLPMDSEDLAKGLFADIRMAFFPPRGNPKEVGVSETQAALCRWSLNKHEVVDVSVRDSKESVVSHYRKPAALLGEARSEVVNEMGLGQKTTIRSPGLFHYSLTLTLLEAEPAPDIDSLFGK